MSRSVIVTSRMPSLEEFGKSLGISKARQRQIIAIMERDPVLIKRAAARRAAEAADKTSAPKKAKRAVAG